MTSPLTIPLPPHLDILKRLFSPDTHDRIFLVGGTVRDLFLGRLPQDIDLVAALPHEQMEALGFRRIHPKSAVSIFFRFHTTLGKIEATTIGATEELESDLRRRDVTVNAMALSLSGNLFDPLHGVDSLARMELHPCSATSFITDPVRIFRLFRFEAQGWRMTAFAHELIREREWNDHFSVIPVERFSAELLKALTGEQPTRFFRGMIEFGVGELFLPELFRMKDIPAGPLEHHPEGDLFTHSVQVLERAALTAGDTVTRFCALFHDLGKLATPPEQYPKHHGHDEAGFRSARAFCQRLVFPAELREPLRWVNRLHTTASRWRELRTSTKIKLAEDAVRGGVAWILPTVAAADQHDGDGMPGWDSAVQIVQLATAALGVDPRLLAPFPTDGVVPLRPDQRHAFLHQKRVERYRATMNKKNDVEEKNRFDTVK